MVGLGKFNFMIRLRLRAVDPIHGPYSLSLVGFFRRYFVDIALQEGDYVGRQFDTRLGNPLGHRANVVLRYETDCLHRILGKLRIVIEPVDSLPQGH